MASITSSVGEALDRHVGEDDHPYRHLDEQEQRTYKQRHDQSIRTTVEDGILVHDIVEDYSDDANTASLSWSHRARTGACSFCEGTVGRDVSTPGGLHTSVYECDTCPFRIVLVDDPDDVVNTGHAMKRRPLCARAIIPANPEWFEEDSDFKSWAEVKEKFEDVPESETASLIRMLEIRKWAGMISDRAFDSDDREIKTVDCGHCDDTVDEPAGIDHAHFGTVCPDCEDVEVWSPDDADLPDDVEERLDRHKSFTVGKIRSILRDALFWNNYVDHVTDDDVPAPEQGINVGKGGKVGVRPGTGEKGTGLRRPDGGAFHNEAQWRTILTDMVETGLIEGRNVSGVSENETATYVATEKGKQVYEEIATCRTCGGILKPYARHSQWTEKGKYQRRSSELTLACPECSEKHSGSGALTLSSSTGSVTLAELPNVEYTQ